MVALWSRCRAKLQAAEKCLAQSEESLAAEKTQTGSLRSRCSGLSSELDVCKVKLQNATDDHAAVTAQALGLSAKLAAAGEQVR